MTGISISECFNLLSNGRRIAIIVPFILFCFIAGAQNRLKTPVMLKVDGGNFEDVSVVMTNNTTGVSNTIPGMADFNLELKIDCDYVISFTKPGYITKRIALNTTAPAERAEQGFYPFPYEVVIFKQYEGVNTVIFNQPVGKIYYNRLIDDFDYDTDYTKQIQSAMKAAEEEIIQKQKEAKEEAERLRKEEEKNKAEAILQAKASAKAEQEAKRKAAEEARVQALQDAKDKKAEEERRKLEAKAVADAEKQSTRAQMEQEERARALAAEGEEARKKSTSATGEDQPAQSRPQGNGEDNRPGINPGFGNEQPVTASSSGRGEDVSKSRPSKGLGADESNDAMADANKRNEKGFVKARGTEMTETKPAEAGAPIANSADDKSTNEHFEVLPDISVEEISEANRTITKVTVRKNHKETIFSKIQYNWGGVFYFHQNKSISESLYFMNTGKR